MNRRNRTWFGALIFLSVGAHLIDVQRGAIAWALLFLQCLVYPQCVYWRARRAADQRAAEMQNLVLDAVLLGIWAAILGFPVWITFIFLVSVSINLTVFSGRRGFVEACAWLAGGAAIGVIAGGFHFQPQTGWTATLLCIASIGAYVFVVAESAYTRALKLHEAREELRASKEELVSQLAEITKLQEQLRDQANHDSLTGLHNRRYLDSSLERELIRCGRAHQPLSLVLIDIDHFKQINDKHGHLAGDQVLKRLADLLGSEVRGSDIACRYGGEEFLLMLPGLSQDVAQERVEDWRKAFAASPARWEGIAVPATLSAGIATFPHNGTTAGALFKAADRALYQAKSDGRNKVRLAEAQDASPA